MKLFTLRLKPGQDLRLELLKFAGENEIRAGAILTCVGALKSATLRMAGATPGNQDVRTYEDGYEIVSLVGTITAEDCHLHIALSDKNGTVIGGHLKGAAVVDVTAEVVIAEDESVIYGREPDETTGFAELVVKPRT